MTAITFLLVILSLLTHSIEANVEKVVFLGPEQTSEHSHLPHHTLLTHIEWLNPTNTTIRRKIHATFEDNSYTSVQQEQQEAWVLLNGLEARQRYEVRVCWPATQPTVFDLSIHDPRSILQSEGLNESLKSYLTARSKVGSSTKSPPLAVLNSTIDTSQSLFLHVKATADYFTTNEQLMTEGLLVDIDIILDPFLLNVFPESLLPTALYILVLAIFSWYLSSWISKQLHSVAQSGQVPRLVPVEKTKLT